MQTHRICLSIDTDVLNLIRPYAARRNMTVSSLLLAHLEDLAKRERRALKARAKMRTVPTGKTPDGDE